MKLDRMIAIGKALLQRAILEQDQEAQARLYALLFTLRESRITELEKQIVTERLQQKREKVA